MRKSKFTEEQIAYALRRVESGTPVKDVIQLERLVADLTLDKAILQEVIVKKGSEAGSQARTCQLRGGRLQALAAQDLRAAPRSARAQRGPIVSEVGTGTR